MSMGFGFNTDIDGFHPEGNRPVTYKTFEEWRDDPARTIEINTIFTMVCPERTIKIINDECKKAWDAGIESAKMNLYGCNMTCGPTCWGMNYTQKENRELLEQIKQSKEIRDSLERSLKTALELKNKYYEESEDFRREFLSSEYKRKSLFEENNTLKNVIIKKAMVETK